MLLTDQVQINAAPVLAGTPIIRRDTNTVVFDLDEAQALQLISELTQNFGNGSFDRITVVVEADQIHAKEVF